MWFRTVHLHTSLSSFWGLAPCTLKGTIYHLFRVTKAIPSLSAWVSSCIYIFSFVHPIEYCNKLPLPAPQKTPLSCFVPLGDLLYAGPLPQPARSVSGSGFSSRSAMHLLCDRMAERAPFEDSRQCH